MSAPAATERYYVVYRRPWWIVVDRTLHVDLGFDQPLAHAAVARYHEDYATSENAAKRYAAKLNEEERNGPK